jgi:hypothetical protein
MPKLVGVPARPGFPATQLYTRISTPVDIQADSVDPAYPTIIFIHHLWGDSFAGARGGLKSAGRGCCGVKR